MGATMRWGGEPLPGLPLIHSGKVRDSYGFSDQRHNGLRLVEASDRVSVFDFVLNGAVKKKGEVLTAINIFWRGQFSGDCDHDLLAFGSEIDEYLPPHLRGNSDLQKRSVIAHSHRMYPIEAIVRGHLTGTGYQAYCETNPHMVSGHQLPDGLGDGSQLPEPIFTPSTKAEVGHDEHLDFKGVNEKYGTQIEKMSLYLFRKGRDYAEFKGVIIADTKFEFARRLVLCDEVLTPDSSRFWKRSEWEAAQRDGKLPPSFDKQFVRNWAREYCVHKLDPKQPEDYAKVRARVVPQTILDETTRLYLEIFELLTGKSLEQFQREDMGIAA